MFTTRAYRTLYCIHCEEERSFAKRVLNHRRHLITTIVTAGLWGFVWAFATAKYARKQWCCQVCYHRHAALEAAEDPRVVTGQ